MPHEQGYAVTHSDFTTTDPVLAEAVARELNRTAPLAWPSGMEE